MLSFAISRSSGLTKRKIRLAIPALIIVLAVFYLIPQVFKFDKETYRFVSAWGREGSQSGQFSGPIGIAIDNASFIYVSDAENNRFLLPAGLRSLPKYTGCPYSGQKNTASLVEADHEEGFRH